jgi:Pyridoxamine 5'-phosphate oxidase
VAMVLDETTRELLDGKNFATVATVNPDGGPQSSVVIPQKINAFSA